MSGSPDRFRHKKSRKNLKIDEEDHARLVSLSKGKKLPMNEIVGFLVDLCLKYSFLDEGWEGRLQASLDMVDADTDRKRPRTCPALAWTQKDGYVCCLKAPRQQKLGDGGLQDMEEICGAHERIKGILDENELLRAQVKNGVTVRVPQCKRGSKYDPDRGELHCRTRGEWKTSEFCENSGCPDLTWIKLNVKGELVRPEEAR